jgi:hypothetical protein
MGLDQADGRGGESRCGVGTLERAGLSLRSRCGEPACPAVAGAGDPPDHGIHAVAVALGVGQPLQDDDGQPFADGDAVGAGVEGPAPARR